jgi:hypothetical protein
MPRPRYPSDDKRIRQRPHIKVHLSVANHPRYGPVFADPFMRGIVTGIWIVGARAHISATKDELSLTNADALFITGKDRMVDAAKVLRRVCEAMNYPFRRACDIHSDCRKQAYESPTNGLRAAYEGVDVHPLVVMRYPCQRPARWVIVVRNFSRKQGFTPHSAADSGVIAEDYAASDSESDSEEPKDKEIQVYPDRMVDASGQAETIGNRVNGSQAEQHKNQASGADEFKRLLSEAGIDEQGNPVKK